jgi:DnaK suppressor protein
MDRRLRYILLDGIPICRCQHRGGRTQQRLPPHWLGCNFEEGIAMAATQSLARTAPAYQPAAGEEYMGDAQLAHFRRVLLEWKQSLLEEVDRTVNHMQDEATTFPDPNDRATQEEEFSLELRTRDRERKLLKKINESLAQIDSGDYGYCEACGVEIGLPRMLARPTATLCIDCKMLEEIREKQGG